MAGVGARDGRTPRRDPVLWLPPAVPVDRGGRTRDRRTIGTTTIGTTTIGTTTIGTTTIGTTNCTTIGTTSTSLMHGMMTGRRGAAQGPGGDGPFFLAGDHA